MAELKEGQKVEQKFLVTIRFKAGNGDTKFTTKDIKESLAELVSKSSTIHTHTNDLKVMVIKQ